MDELTSIKQALSFLLEQENIRQQELNALNEKIEGLSGSVNDRVKEFSGWVDDRNFKDFSDKYGEQLSPYAEKMNKIRGDGYDFMRDAYDSYDPSVYSSQDEYIADTISSLDKYLEDIGIPKDVKVEVKADMNGDGITETVIDSTETVEPADTEKTEDAEKQEEKKEKSEDEKSEAEDEKSEVEDEEEKKFMDSISAAVDKELAKNK